MKWYIYKCRTGSDFLVEVSRINQQGFKLIILRGFAKGKTYAIKNTFSNTTGFLIKNENWVSTQRVGFHEVIPDEIYKLASKPSDSQFFTNKITIV